MYKTILEISGMKCGMCECHINDLIRKNVKVKKVKSSYKKKTCIFVHSEKINSDEIINIINKQGYIVTKSQFNINES